MTQLLTQNTKLKKTSILNEKRVFNFGIPSVKTCIFAGDCKKFCYASKAAYTWKNVKTAFEYRLEITKKEEFIEMMSQEITKKRVSHLRIHDSGDFYSRTYIQKWFQIMNSFPNVTFYAYTKAIPLFENVELPENFVLIKSLGGTKDHLIKNTDRHAKIFYNLEDLEREGYVNASENDLLAIGENKKVGLMIH